MTYDEGRERYYADRYPSDTDWGNKGWARLMAALAEPDAADVRVQEAGWDE